jgi:hypothetical protein
MSFFDLHKDPWRPSTQDGGKGPPDIDPPELFRYRFLLAASTLTSNGFPAIMKPKLSGFSAVEGPGGVSPSPGKKSLNS